MTVNLYRESNGGQRNGEGGWEDHDRDPGQQEDGWKGQSSRHCYKTMRVWSRETGKGTETGRGGGCLSKRLLGAQQDRTPQMILNEAGTS